MVDMKVEFLGGELAGQCRSPIDESELTKMGYRSALITRPQGKELATCIAVPFNWTATEAHQEISKKLGANAQRSPGRRSQ